MPFGAGSPSGRISALDRWTLAGQIPAAEVVPNNVSKHGQLIDTLPRARTARIAVAFIRLGA